MYCQHYQPQVIQRIALNSDLITVRAIRWPNALTVDLPTKHIYWMDAHHQSIETMDFNGKNRYTVSKSFYFLGILSFFMFYLPHLFIQAAEIKLWAAMEPHFAKDRVAISV